MKKTLLTSYAVAIAMLSSIASAQQMQVLTAPLIPSSQVGSGSSGVGSMFKNIVLAIKDISVGLYGTLIVIALIFFFVGIINYLMPGKGADAHKEGLRFIGFGILALAVMVGIWGIITFMSANLGIGVGGDIPTPGVPFNVRTY
ncbi:MAG: hypothetical protein QG614_542 [Patescibacteria group bacterium]|nr:hypothetical protein [Patescibacteria group bacterium]